MGENRSANTPNVELMLVEICLTPEQI